MLLDYKIGKNVSIGKKVVLNCNEVNIQDNVLIGNQNSFACNKLEIGAYTTVLTGNTIVGGGDFRIGNHSRIIYDHYFDVWNSIVIGNHTWVAGKQSQFWTHGSIHTKQGIKPLGIEIGDNVYIGSRCSFAPGVSIGNENLIGLGSVVSSSFPESLTIISGNPASVIKKQIDWRENW